MKRLFTLSVVFILCAIIFIIPTSAEEYDSYDSRYVTSEEKSQLAISYYDDIVLTSDDTVIKLYTDMFLDRFEQHEDILNIIKKSSMRYMIVTSFGDTYYKIIRDGSGITIGSDKGAIEWSGFYTYTQSPELIFGYSVKINKIYCLDGFENSDNAYVYYETDHGIYVLFKEYPKAKNTYLFPLDDFYEFAKLYDIYGDDAYKKLDMESYLISDTPHAVPHPDTDNDEKCDVCGIAIPENNDPFLHISGINTDKTTDKTEETDPSIDKFSKGCSSSVAFSAVVIVGIMSGTALIVKKKED